MSSTTSSNFFPLEKNTLRSRHTSHFRVPQIITVRSENVYSSLKSHHLHSTTTNRRGRLLSAANTPPPEAPPSPGWSKWMLLMLIPPVIFIFFKTKWGRLLLLKHQMDKTLATVGVMADELEEVAEKVDKMVDDISEKLPAGSNLKKAIDMVGDLAEQTDKAAESVDDLSEKMDDAEDKLKNLLLESAKKKAKWGRS